jgi:hypothetical protein
MALFDKPVFAKDVPHKLQIVFSAPLADLL